ncbi:MAG: RluA family pseudouridine synthase [Polyangiaceae bacterium]
MKRFVVSSEKTLAVVLAQLSIPSTFVRDGRVFVGSVRARIEAHPLSPGDEIRIQEPESAHDRSPQGKLDILFEDEELCVVHKPAGISTIGDQKSESDSLRGLVAAHRGRTSEHVHATSRLDRLVSGVVTFALSKRARDELSRARDEGHYERRYFAIAQPTKRFTSMARIWNAPIGRAKNPRLRMIGGKDATLATTHTALVERTAEAMLLALEPQTGRTHQLRLHAAHAGLPLFGDKDYGGATSFTGDDGSVMAIRRIALHAARIRFPHRGRVLEWRAPVDSELALLWKSLGGPDEAWNTAWSCDV